MLYDLTMRCLPRFIRQSNTSITLACYPLLFFLDSLLIVYSSGSRFRHFKNVDSPASASFISVDLFLNKPSVRYWSPGLINWVITKNPCNNLHVISPYAGWSGREMVLVNFSVGHSTNLGNSTL